MENACEVLLTCQLIFKLICVSYILYELQSAKIYLQVLVLADLHNTTQLKLHVLKFINDRRVAEASFILFEGFVDY